jgi:anti-sigma B factor antagonist
MDPSTEVAVPPGITVTRDDDAVLVHLHGEIDASLRDAASRCMVEVIGCEGPVTIDTSQVTFIDSSGLAFLLQLHGVATDGGRPLLLRDPSGAVLELLALVGLDTLFATEAG